MPAEHRLLPDLKVCQGQRDSERDVILFGSQIQGDSIEDAGSDILVMFLDNDALREQIKFANLFYEPYPGCDTAGDGSVICITKSKLLKAKQPIFMNALKA